MRSAVDFPQPDGPSSTRNSWSGLELEVAHRDDVAEPLRHMVEHDPSHRDVRLARRNQPWGSHRRSAATSSAPGGANSTTRSATTDPTRTGTCRIDPRPECIGARRHRRQHQFTVVLLELPIRDQRATDAPGDVMTHNASAYAPASASRHHAFGRGARDVVAATGTDEKRFRRNPRGFTFPFRSTCAPPRQPIVVVPAHRRAHRAPSARRTASSRSGSSVVEHERVGGCRGVAPQADLRGELHGQPHAAATCTPSHADRLATPAPASTASASVASTRSARYPRPALRRAPTRSAARRDPARARARRRATSRVRLSRAGPRPVRPRVAPATALATRCRGPTDGSTRRSRGARRRPRVDPEVVVLAVPVDGEVARVQAAGMHAHRRLDDCEHTVRGDPHEVRPRPQIVDDLLDRHDDAAAGRERSPHPLEQRRVERDVAVRSATGPCIERDVGHQRREQPDFTELRVDPRVRLVLRHRRSRDRARRDGGQPARRLRAVA